MNDFNRDGCETCPYLGISKGSELNKPIERCYVVCDNPLASAQLTCIHPSDSSLWRCATSLHAGVGLG